MPIVSTGLSDAELQAVFGKGLQEAPAMWPQLATTIKCNGPSVKHRWLGTVPSMREWGSGRLAKGVHDYKYDVENQRYELTIEVDRVELEDDQTGQILMRVREMGFLSQLHKDELIAHLLVNGGGAGFECYDEEPFFSATHESGKSGEQSNQVTSAITDKDDPTIAEFKDAMRLAIARMLALKNDQGRPMNLRASGLIALVPPSMFITAREAVNASIIDATTNSLASVAQVESFAFLENTDKWYLLKTDVPVRPFILQDRVPLELRHLTYDSETGFLRDVFLYGARARYAIAYGHWQHAIEYTFTTA
jgi:phage major head subunit gpT-like protein